MTKDKWALFAKSDHEPGNLSARAPEKREEPDLTRNFRMGVNFVRCRKSDTQAQRGGPAARCTSRTRGEFFYPRGGDDFRQRTPRSTSVVS